MKQWEVRGEIRFPASVYLEAPTRALALTLSKTIRFGFYDDQLWTEDFEEYLLETEAERAEFYPGSAEQIESDEEPLHPSNNLGLWGDQGT